MSGRSPRIPGSSPGQALDSSKDAVRRDGDALVFTGALSRAAVTGLWRQAVALLDGVRRFDLDAVAHVDSAGLAMLAELAARAGPDPITLSLSRDGAPSGLVELRTAYRLGPALDYAT